MTSMTDQARVGMNACYELVKEFQGVMSEPVGGRPSPLSDRRLRLRCEWIRGEVDELARSSSLTDQVDAICDIMYFCLGTLVEAGVPPGEAFVMVHQANMRKSGEDGRVELDEDGRIVKPNDWYGPEGAIFRYLDRLKTD